MGIVGSSVQKSDVLDHSRAVGWGIDYQSRPSLTHNVNVWSVVFGFNFDGWLADDKRLFVDSRVDLDGGVRFCVVDRRLDREVWPVVLVDL